jgi:hypothetical protein
MNLPANEIAENQLYIVVLERSSLLSLLFYTELIYTELREQLM